MVKVGLDRHGRQCCRLVSVLALKTPEEFFKGFDEKI